MRDIEFLASRIIAIYPADRVPFYMLRTAVALSFLREKYSFVDLAIEPPPGMSINFSGGAFSESEETACAVNSLQFADRKVVVDLKGTSDQAKSFFDDIGEFLEGLDPENHPKIGDPLVTTYESVCVATMEFGWEDLFSRGFGDTIQGFLREAAEGPSPAVVTSITARVQLRFEQSPRLADHGITLANKPFSIEPRVNVPLSARRFVSSAPLESSGHLKVLSRLEETLTGKAKRRKTRPAR